MESPLPSLCSSLLHPSYINFSLSLFITFGILVSYLPQHYKIIHRGSSEGISPYFVLLGVTSGTCAFANIIILSREVLGCCSEIGGLNCIAASLGVAQVGLQWTCFAIMYVDGKIGKAKANSRIDARSTSYSFLSFLLKTIPMPYHPRTLRSRLL